MKDDSSCPKGILCNFERVQEYPDALIEICIACGKKLIYNKINGEIDENKYLRDHKRDTIQPFGSDHYLYGKIYGFAEVNRAISKYKTKSKETDKKEWEELKKESLDYIKKRVLAPGSGGTDWT